MADLALSVTVTRAALGLPDLQLNDHSAYYVAAQFLGGQVQWNRQQATSPFLDGSVTTFRSRQLVTEQLAVEVLADTAGQLHARVDALVAAFSQDAFTLLVDLDDAAYAYACEAADYQLAWAGPRMAARQAQVVLSVPRQPVSLLGVV